MTRAQIAQFVLTACLSALQLLTLDQCEFPPEQTVANFMLNVPFLALFLNFYLREYVWRTNGGRGDAATNGKSVNFKKD